MKYFAIEHSLNEKIMGKVEQTKEYLHHCNVWEDPNFIDKFPFQKIDNSPILSNPVLYSASKLTDLIWVCSIGFSYGSMVVSEKFKTILDRFHCYGVQFFPTYLIHKNKEIQGYWQTHIYDFPYDFVDFKKTSILLKDRDINRNVVSKHIDINNKDEFLNLSSSIKYPKMIFLEDIKFNQNMNLDYFFLRFFENGGSLGVVSEKLKDEIEKQGCIGIEFRPIGLSLQNWYHSGEREKIYGKM